MQLFLLQEGNEHVKQEPFMSSWRVNSQENGCFHEWARHVENNTSRVMVLAQVPGCQITRHMSALLAHHAQITGNGVLVCGVGLLASTH